MARGCQLVVDGHADVSVAGQRGADLDFTGGPLVAAGPAAAVDDHHARVFGAGLLDRRKVEIGFFSPAGLEVFDVLVDVDFSGAEKGSGQTEQSEAWEEVHAGERSEGGRGFPVCRHCAGTGS